MRQGAILGVAWLAAGLLAGGAGAGGDTNAAGGRAERIGVYDSRAVAYAAFWAPAHRAQIDALTAAAKAARAAGDTNRCLEIGATLEASQAHAHLQVFSTAPIDDVLATMQARVAAVAKEAGVSTLVSQWDEPALAAHPGAERVDVTDLLLRDFTLTKRQKTALESLRKQAPVPLDKAKALMQDGTL